MKLVTRAEWGARSPRHPLDAMPSGVKGVKLHYTGGFVDPAILDDHDKCARAIKGIQNGHMDGNGWNDIGYSFVECPHGVAFVGRGLHKLPAANGPGLNSGHYAILLLVGNKGLTLPTAAQKAGVLDLIDYIRKEGPAGKEVKGHRDGYATDCPGDPTYKWIKAGLPLPQNDPTEELVSDLPTLQEGDEGWDVKSVRYCLGARNYLPAEVTSSTDFHDWLDQVKFDPQLGQLVRAFQTAKGLDADGIVGKNTWRKLMRV